MHIKKSRLLLFSLLLVINAFAQKRPNIVLIMADDLGYSDIGCYGSEIPTPNLDALAKNGIRLSQFYNGARCCPTRASLMTGLFPHQAGIGHMTETPNDSTADHWGTPGYQGYLNNNCVTIAEVLKPAGYHTYMTGKWHLGLHGKQKWPLQRGYEKYYGILAGAASYFKPQGGRGLYYNNTKLPPPSGDYYTTDAFTDSAIHFIKDQKDKKPFFLYLAYNAPHWPLQAKEADIKKFEGLYKKGWDELRSDRYAKQLSLGIVDSSVKLSPRGEEVKAWDELGENEQNEVAYRMAVYAAQVSCIDQNVGKLIASLKKAGQFENTLIIFLSDNGACPEPYKLLGGGKFSDINNPEVSGSVSYGMGWANASNTPYRKWKTELEEGGISAPFILSWPAVISGSSQNSIVSTPAYLIDVMPTIIELARAKYPATYKNKTIYSLEGKSIVPVIKNKSLVLHEYMFWEHEGNDAVRKGNWKAVKDRKGEWQLFDLSTDRAEGHDVSKTNPKITKDLTEKWNKWAVSHFVFPKHKGDSK